MESDLRPISLTPVLSKVLESFVYVRMMDHIAEAIDKNQSGALKGSSTVHALLRLVNNLHAKSDDRVSCKIICILLIDYSTSFDQINPNILM